MIVTKAYIDELRKITGLRIDKPLQKYLLAEYGEEPFPYEYSDQDLYEQIRKLEYQYWKGELNVTVKVPKERLKERYESLKEAHQKVLGQKACLEDEVEQLKKELIKHGLMEPF